MGYDERLYHLKNQRDFFCCKPDVDDSLLHLFGVMSAIFTDLNCRYNVLFPLCIRQTCETFDLVFLKLNEYKIGLPACSTLRNNLLDSVKKVIDCVHKCEVAHLDLYPSNIMWKEVEGSEEVHVMIIDWDSAHFVHEFLHEHVSRRLSSNQRKYLAEQFAVAAGRPMTLCDYDLSLLHVLESNVDHESLQASQKTELDGAFFALVNSSVK
jgi:hypothetical protein